MRKSSWISVLAVVLCLALVPGPAFAMTWSAFVTQAHNARDAAGGSGSVTMDDAAMAGDTTVGAATDADVLDMRNVTLVINGVTFQNGMVISGGNIQLQNTTVHTTDASALGGAITLADNASGTNTVTLTLDDATVVDATGSDNAGISAVLANPSDVTIVNHGTIEADGGAGIGGTVYSAGDGSLTIANSGTITSQGSEAVHASVYAPTGDATVTVVNSGTLSSQEDAGVYADAYGTPGSDTTSAISVTNSGTITSGNFAGIVTLVEGDNTSTSVSNSGTVTSDNFAAILAQVSPDTTLALHNSGRLHGGDVTYGSVTHPNVGILVGVDFTTMSEADLAAVTAQYVHDHSFPSNTNVLVSGIAFDPVTNTPTFVDIYIPAQDQPNPPTPAPVVITPEKNHEKHKGIAYSEEWLWKAWLNGTSYDLRVFELAQAADGTVDKGEPVVFAEKLGGNKSLSLNLRVHTKTPGSKLIELDMRTLEDLSNLQVRTLSLTNRDTVDTYPIQEIYDALQSQGYGDCKAVWLAGEKADAVIIDKDGNKVVLK